MAILILKIFREKCKIFRISSAFYATNPNTKHINYKDTILLPKTDFKTRHSGLERVKIDEQIQKSAEYSTVYSWQRENCTKPDYILHDGPPYANGDLHIGHAVNKIIKDIKNRHRVLRGQRVHYVPGWDCHGLPIELKALEQAETDERPKAGFVRDVARQFANKAVVKQRSTFESWGVMANWSHDFYLTMDPKYVKTQLRLFERLHSMKLVYRAMKPVYWSPTSRTALAEAELEYDPQYKSTQAYVQYKVEEIPPALKVMAAGNDVYLLIWTTTPWSLVGNQTVCFNRELEYSLVRVQGCCGVHVVCSQLVDSVASILGRSVDRVASFQGKALEGCRYYNPMKRRVQPTQWSRHASAAGTGLVHTAPAHGPDDFLVALRTHMPVECHIDESGCYTGLGPELDGLAALTDGQERVMKIMAKDILHSSPYVHSYPLDWRTKSPVILRASRQWFIDTEQLKGNALKALESVSILPEAGASKYRAGLRAQIEQRPYWCVSRQRAWGTPIPAIYNGETPIVHSDIVEKMCSLIDDRGTDFWWKCDVKDLVTDRVIGEHHVDIETATKGADIMDIWLDSGVSWSAVLDGRTADVYVEGLDQFTGWFQSSLLTSIALRGESPYRSIFVHGFVVDERGRKMSKSVGNVVDPDVVTRGGQDLKKEPAYGVDTLRWWVARHGTQHTHIQIGKNILDECHSEVARLRNTMKFLLGAISDANIELFTQNHKLNTLDRYMIAELDSFVKEIDGHFENFRYNNVSQLILSFVSNQISSLYCHCVKDRLYCEGKDSEKRRSVQIVLHSVLVALCKCLGPIMPNLVEEVWSFHPLRASPFFKTVKIPVIENCDFDSLDAVLDLRREINKNKKTERFAVEIKASSEVISNLKAIALEDLLEVLQVSKINFTIDESKDTQIVLSDTDNKQCLRCKRYNVENDANECSRCELTIANKT